MVEYARTNQRAPNHLFGGNDIGYIEEWKITDATGDEKATNRLVWLDR